MGGVFHSYRVDEHQRCGSRLRFVTDDGSSHRTRKLSDTRGLLGVALERTTKTRTIHLLKLEQHARLAVRSTDHQRMASAWTLSSIR